MRSTGSSDDSPQASTNRYSRPSLQKIAAQKLAQLRNQRAQETITRSKPYRPHEPSERQSEFLGLDCEEALYGGAAGGGKSDALLMGALQYVHVPGYAAILFRRTEPDLLREGAILDRAKEWWTGTLATWDEKLFGFRFPTAPGEPDATISFGTLFHENDKLKYQSAEYQFIGFDELTQFTKTQYLYLFSRLRKLKGFPVPTRMRGATNPGGPGHEWVKDRFIRFAKLKSDNVVDLVEYRRRRFAGSAPKDRVFVSPPSPEALEVARKYNMVAQGAHFIPSWKEDNPGLDVADYAMKLARLDPVERARLDEGDWDAVPSGRYFQEGWFKFIEPDDPMLKRLLRQIRYWDLAATKKEIDDLRKGRDPDWTAGARGGVIREKTGEVKLVVVHCRRFREDPGTVETNIAQQAELDGKRVEIVLEEEPGSSGKNNTHNYTVKVLAGFTVRGDRKTGPKPEYWKPVSALAREGNLYLVRGTWNQEFIAELCSLPSGGHDDQADAVGGLYAEALEDNGAARTRALANSM